jgi:hypothetical protein
VKLRARGIRKMREKLPRAASAGIHPAVPVALPAQAVQFSRYLPIWDPEVTLLAQIGLVSDRKAVDGSVREVKMLVIPGPKELQSVEDAMGEKKVIWLVQCRQLVGGRRNSLLFLVLPKIGQGCGRCSHPLLGCRPPASLEAGENLG